MNKFHVLNNSENEETCFRSSSNDSSTKSNLLKEYVEDIEEAKNEKLNNSETNLIVPNELTENIKIKIVKKEKGNYNIDINKICENSLINTNNLNRKSYTTKNNTCRNDACGNDACRTDCFFFMNNNNNVPFLLRLIADFSSFLCAVGVWGMLESLILVLSKENYVIKLYYYVIFTIVFLSFTSSFYLYFKKSKNNKKYILNDFKAYE
ncbi:conserved protein, unknown function [Hepatocystis sp. ex Piliocolobus tephrosceles]|nr:conserved protein, unknown function [Hepatocystis sp. ex Piliocolobus tephrosceles]